MGVLIALHCEQHCTEHNNALPGLALSVREPFRELSAGNRTASDATQKDPYKQFVAYLWRRVLVWTRFGLERAAEQQQTARRSWRVQVTLLSRLTAVTKGPAS